MLLLGTALLFAGCGGGGVSNSGQPGTSTPQTGTGPAIAGSVFAGTAPLSGASVSLYSVGTAGNGSTPQALLGSPVTTAVNGSFQIAAGSYTCPADSTLPLYLIARGGAVSSGAQNSAIQYLEPLGTCGSLAGASSFLLNELTTAAATYALRPFLSAGGRLGSSATNAAGLALAIAGAARLADPHTGSSPGGGFPANGTSPARRLNTVANAVHACVAAAGPSSSPCTALFSALATSAATPDNTLDALLAMLNAPGRNVAAVFALSAASPTFSPALSTAPADWLLPLAFTGGGLNQPTTAAIDSKGQVWVANLAGVASLFSTAGVPLLPNGTTAGGLGTCYGGAVDATDRFWMTNGNSSSGVNGGLGSLTVLSNASSGSPIAMEIGAGGLNVPVAIAWDPGGTAWVVNYGNARISLLDAAGTPRPPVGGVTSSLFAFPVAVATDAAGQGWIGNQSGSAVVRVGTGGSAATAFTVGPSPSAVAVDPSGSVWAANYFGDTLGLVSASGAVLSGGGFTGGGLAHPQGLAVDGAGTVWVANYRGGGLSEFSGASSASPGTALSPAVGWSPETALNEAFSVAVDAAGNVWVTSSGDNRLVEYVGAATPVKTPLLGAARVP